MIKAMRKCDFIFDVTLGDSFSDIYSIDQCLSNIRFKFLAEIFGRKYILLPQTYGPFEDKKCRDRSIHILNHADYIFCRDKKIYGIYSSVRNKEYTFTIDYRYGICFAL